MIVTLLSKGFCLAFCNWWGDWSTKVTFSAGILSTIPSVQNPVPPPTSATYKRTDIISHTWSIPHDISHKFTQVLFLNLFQLFWPFYVGNVCWLPWWRHLRGGFRPKSNIHTSPTSKDIPDLEDAFKILWDITLWKTESAWWDLPVYVCHQTGDCHERFFELDKMTRCCGKNFLPPYVRIRLFKLTCKNSTRMTLCFPESDLIEFDMQIVTLRERSFKRAGWSASVRISSVQCPGFTAEGQCITVRCML